MTPSRWPVEKEAECPVVQNWVTLRAFEVAVRNSARSAIEDATCSNVGKCLQAYGSIEHIQGCLLNHLNSGPASNAIEERTMSVTCDA